MEKSNGSRKRSSVDVADVSGTSSTVWSAVLTCGGVGVITLAVGGWLLAPREPNLVRLSELPGALAVLACLASVPMVLVTVVLRKRASRRAVLTSLTTTAIGFLVGFAGWNVYGELGVFIGLGDRYWLHRAINAESESDARSCLRVILSATQYGVDIAENRVFAIEDDEVRDRFVDLLDDESYRDVRVRYELRRAQGKRSP